MSSKNIAALLGHNLALELAKALSTEDAAKLKEHLTTMAILGDVTARVKLFLESDAPKPQIPSEAKAKIEPIQKELESLPPQTSTKEFMDGYIKGFTEGSLRGFANGIASSN